MPTPAGLEVPERVRFVGKHSKDMCLSLYVQKRNIVEVERTDGAGARAVCEPLGCIVRIRNDVAASLTSRGQVVAVGILARLVCDFGLQYTEHVLYQLETQLYPPPPSSQKGQELLGGVFDLTTRFVTSLPDEWHIPFLVKLPGGLPPSVQLRNPTTLGSAAHWGLTYYVFAYITNAQAVTTTLERYGVTGAWPRLRIGRRHSKVFLSFSKINVESVEKITHSVPPATGISKRRTLLGGGSPLILEASLDKAVYHSGDPINVTIRLQNNGKQRIAGLRITVKQLVTIKYGSEPRQTIKTTIAEFEGHGQQLKNALCYDTSITVDARFNPSRNNYQLALETRFPRNPDELPVISASCRFSGLAWRAAAAFGIDRLRLFYIEYYVNVHAVIPWASDVIVKLPFHVAHGESNNINDSTKLLSEASQEKRPSNSEVSLIRGNLIAFDVDEDGLNAPDDLDLEEQPKSSSNVNNNSSEDFKVLAREGVKFNEDLLAAREKLRINEKSLRVAQQEALQQKLDRRSLTIQYCTDRVAINRCLVDQISPLVTQDLPRLRSSLTMAHQSPENPRLPKFYAAQAVAARLISLGKAHVVIVPISCSRDQIEKHLEKFARLVDDFELFLVRAERSPGDASEVLDRMEIVAMQLVGDLPGYERIEASIQALYITITQHRWAGSKTNIRKIETQGNDSDGEQDGFVGPSMGGEDFEAENVKDELMAAMANQFQTLFIEGQDPEADSFKFEKNFTEYVIRLCALLSSDLPQSTLSVTAYFHWRFLLVLIEQFYLATVGSISGRLLFAELRDSLRWSSEVEQRIPARFLLPPKPAEELEETANQIVVVMQRL